MVTAPIAANPIVAEAREAVGTGGARATRRAGRVPAIIYGGGAAPVTISLDPRDVIKGVNTEGFYARLLPLTVDGKVVEVLPKAVQFHPVTDAPVHADFLRVDKNTTIRVEVPVHLLNQDKCRGLKMGGILNIVQHTVEVLCPATSIPSGFDVDLTDYKVAEAIKSSAIKLPEGVKFTILGRDFTIATIVAPAGADEKKA
jgi:large subunit ribosomal protein L25